jgi:hypothetical protein
MVTQLIPLDKVPLTTAINIMLHLILQRQYINVNSNYIMAWYLNYASPAKMLPINAKLPS